MSCLPSGELPAPITRAGYALEWAAQANLTKRQSALFFLLVRQTLLWDTTWDWLSASYIEKYAGISKSHASETISELEAMGVCRRVRRVVPRLKDKRPKLCLEICEAFAISSIIQDTKREQEVPGTGNKQVPASGNQQKNYVTEELEQYPLSSSLRSEETRAREDEGGESSTIKHLDRFRALPLSARTESPPPAAMPDAPVPIPPTPNGAPPPLPPPPREVADAYITWRPLGMNPIVERELAKLAVEFGAEAVCAAIERAQLFGKDISYPIQFIRGGLERLRRKELGLPQEPKKPPVQTRPVLEIILNNAADNGREELTTVMRQWAEQFPKAAITDLECAVLSVPSFLERVSQHYTLKRLARQAEPPEMPSIRTTSSVR